MPATDAANHKFIEMKPLWVGKVGAAGVASAGATTIPLASAAGLTNGNVYVVTANRTNASGTTKNPASQRETFIAKLSGTDLINAIRQVEGTAQAWPTDTVLEILVNATTWNKMIEGIELEHNQDGTHKNTILALLAGAQTFTGIKTFTTGLLKAADIIDTVQALKVLVFAGVASAVNWVKMTSAATGNGPIIEPDGSDTNIQLELKGKGNKGVRIQDIVPKVSALADGANIPTDASFGNYFTVTIAGNRTIDPPTNLADGQTITYEIKQDATGSRLITWSSAAGGFSFGSSSAPVLSTAPGKVDLVAFRYSATVGKLCFLGIKSGY